MSIKVGIVVEINVTRHNADDTFSTQDLLAWVDAAFKYTFPTRTELRKKTNVIVPGSLNGGATKPNVSISVVSSAVGIYEEANREKA